MASTLDAAKGRLVCAPAMPGGVLLAIDAASGAACSPMLP